MAATLEGRTKRDRGGAETPKRRRPRAKKRPTRRSSAPPAESAVYDGSRLLGTITERARHFAARSAAGRSLGKFQSVHDAIGALCEAAASSRRKP